MHRALPWAPERMDESPQGDKGRAQTERVHRSLQNTYPPFQFHPHGPCMLSGVAEGVGRFFLSPFYRRWTEIQREFLLPRDNNYGCLMPAIAQGGTLGAWKEGPGWPGLLLRGPCLPRNGAGRRGQLSPGAFPAAANRGRGQNGLSEGPEWRVTSPRSAGFPSVE